MNPGRRPAGPDRVPPPPPQSLLHSGVASAVLSLWGFGLTFVSVPIMVSGLGLTDYGIYSLVFTLVGYGAFLDLGFGWTGMRFVAEAHARRDPEGVAAFAWAVLLYQSMVGVVVALGIWGSAAALGRWLASGEHRDAERIANILPLAAAWFLLTNVVTVLVGVLRGVRRYVAGAVVAGTLSTIGVLGGALAVQRGQGLRGAMTLQLIAAAAATCGGAIALRDVLSLGRRGDFIASSASRLREMLSFSLWTVITRLLQVAVLQGDKVLATKAAGAAGLALYVVPFNVAQKLNVVGSAAITAVYPVAASATHARAEFLETYFRAARIVHALTAAPMVCLLVFSPLFLHSWIGPEMAAGGSGYLRILAVGFWIGSVTSVEAGCLEGWGLARTTALAALSGLGAALLAGSGLLMSAGALTAVAGGVATWLAVSGVINAIAWYRLSAFPISRLWRELLRPVGEVALIGFFVGQAASGWIHPGRSGLAACAALVILLTVFGAWRVSSRSERSELWRWVTASLAV